MGPLVARTWSRTRPVLAVVLPAWLVARAVVLGALAAARLVADRFPAGPSAHRVSLSLVGWDAEQYQRIAEHGYVLGTGRFRFFPLFPLLVRLVTPVTPGGTTVALVVIANGCSLAFAGALYVLTRRETSDTEVARRAAWLGCIAPPAFVMVMGYSEPLFLLLAVGTFLALRSRRFGVAAVLGLLGALCRPVGLLLALPAAIESLRGWRDATWPERGARACSVAAPPLGLLGYLLWVRDRTGDLMRPFDLQQTRHLRGEVLNPVGGMIRAFEELVNALRVQPVLHVGWALIGLGLCVVAFRRLPAAYGAFAAALILVALAASRLDSVDRYVFNAFPILMAAAIVVRRPRTETLLFAALGGAMGIYALLSFLAVVTP